jgi:hypothetical protein
VIRAIVIVALVAGVLVGGLLILRSRGAMGMPDADVMERAKKRAREQAASEAEEDRRR